MQRIRLRLIRTLVAAGAAVAVLGAVAAPASATSIQNAATGQPYTGNWNGGLFGNATFTSSLGTVTCNVSTPSGQVTNAGSTGNPATGSLIDIDWKNNTGPNAPCTDDIFGADHVDNEAADLPWPWSALWLSDNTSGAPNGTFTISFFTVTATFDLPATCTYAGDFNNTSATTRQVQADFLNPNNTSGNTELRFVNEPLELVSGDMVCATTATMSATYGVIGSGATKLQIRENPPVPPGNPPANPPVNPPATPATGTAGKAKKCKKSKKGAAAAKKCKRKK